MYKFFGLLWSGFDLVGFGTLSCTNCSVWFGLGDLWVGMGLIWARSCTHFCVCLNVGVGLGWLWVSVVQAFGFG